MPALLSEGADTAFCIRRLIGVNSSVSLSPAENSRSLLSGSDAEKTAIVGRDCCPVGGGDGVGGAAHHEAAGGQPVAQEPDSNVQL